MWDNGPLWYDGGSKLKSQIQITMVSANVTMTKRERRGDDYVWICKGFDELRKIGTNPKKKKSQRAGRHAGLVYTRL